MDLSAITLAGSLAGTATAGVAYVREARRNDRRSRHAAASGEDRAWDPEVYQHYPSSRTAEFKTGHEAGR